ncbi:MAG: hypothetical protein K8R18_11925 [Parvibaculum sp.]|uniref:hypothetical protein n=1 Tax=Parvibaculum sp. TaxID=2024848 RepID=UPI0025F3D68D|nr:hypothetical protein [Parvibaculum sp.]MCE9650320.1 hypothetical protein [Parvibaculum sp.]
MLKSKFVQGLLLTSALTLLAACSSDGNSGIGGGSGGGSGGLSTLSAPELGVTGEGGTTEALGVAALTDPILGTDGVLGGGGDGQVGGQIPADQLDPLSSQLQPVSEQIAAAVPLDMVTSQLPALGVNGEDGLVQDLSGQDPLTGIVGSTGVVGALLGGGNDGQLGDVVPAGTVPSLPGGDDPLAALTGLTAGTPLETLTSALPTGGNADVLGQLQNAPALAQTLVGGASSTDPQDILGSVTGAANPDTLTSLVSQVTSAAGQ